ncbi:precorrin-2 dehydrogenase/sirohydrochlorin ferrochelatase family protein [Lacrimispora sp. 210928-DFI.3.58]|uniref:precorrin-2 dehydrogenase/sirohydrochlorin ferrochelatase family protein n=1 Tax=Lacrimispora sp. 210928-DFI.3.58 TaxID=2883214 RepID=UPI001D076319|nr:bifunctional precorrin-2 dehydrogenase/sirohydrochlorin ferrochelatase [Lacrimispora sp. 210928-DFI.3.58]MCB7319042.1 bifunctional precorrin-2 dehydrogenase/sirohydrochlorin ferrochelatase [Lacrimispora sp. 210928-DFI.3.58]
MGYFPFFMEIENKKCVIAGGGTVAFRKVTDLLPFGAVMDVIAPDMVPELEALALAPETAGRVCLIRRPFQPIDIGQADFVIAATGDKDLNSSVSAWCKERRIPVNVVDEKELCTFFFPSIVKDGPVTVGISTGGNSPVLASYAKKLIKEALPSGFGELAWKLGALRERVKEAFPQSSGVRADLFHSLAEKGLENNCCLTDEMAEDMIKERLENRHG